MKKYLYILLVLFLGCADFSSSPEQLPTINLDLHFNPGQPVPKSSQNSSNDVLNKTQGSAITTVLLLNCNGSDSTKAFDSSIYANDAYLYNVKRFYQESDQKRGLTFEGDAHAQVYNADELNPQKDFYISAQINLFSSVSDYEVFILHKMTYNGGYAFGLFQNRLFFRAIIDGSTYQVEGRTVLDNETWYKVGAAFVNDSLRIFVNDKQENALHVPGTISTSYGELIIGAASYTTADYGQFFYGQMDDIQIKQTFDFYDFDLIRAAVFDLSNFANVDSFHNSVVYNNFDRKYYDIIYHGDQQVLSWNILQSLWNEFFLIVADQSLEIKNGYAEGAVNGVEGLNFVLVAAIQGERVLFFGYKVVAARKDVTQPFTIEMWQTFYEEP